MRFLACCCCIACLAAEDLGQKPAPIDDPLGLGERLALIDHLREERGQEIAAGASLEDLRRLYWSLQAADAAPSHEELMARESLERMRDEIRRRFNVEPDATLDLSGLQALKRQLIAESMAEVEAMAAAEQQSEGSHRVRSFGDIVSLSRKAVVLIATETSTGSGFFISSGGTLVTNRHVCPSEGAIVRVYWDSSIERPMQQFRVERVSDERDCAYLRPLRSTPPYHHFDMDRDWELGENVVAVGFPMGAHIGRNLGTNAIDISLHRGTVTGERRKGDEIWFIQSDCQTGQGNSGGPLLDAGSGRVIGIVTAGYDPRDDGVHGSMMVFSIPIADVLAALRL